DAAASLLRRYQFDGAQHMRAKVLIAPQDWNGRRFGRPRLDLVRDRPERARLQPFEFVVVGEQFRRILDIGSAGHVFPVVFTRFRCHVALLYWRRVRRSVVSSSGQVSLRSPGFRPWHGPRSGPIPAAPSWPESAGL